MVPGEGGAEAGRTSLTKSYARNYQTNKNVGGKKACIFIQIQVSMILVIILKLPHFRETLIKTTIVYLFIKLFMFTEKRTQNNIKNC